MLNSQDVGAQWRAGLEDLFFEHGVDLVFEAHQHTYERLWPTYRGKVFNGTKNPDNPYEQPGAPTHIVSGSVGCQEKLDKFGPPLGNWSAVRIPAYGYGHLTFFNASHAHWQQFFMPNRSVADELWIVQNNHGPFHS